MNQNQFLQEVQALRHLIVEQHAYDRNLACPTWQADGKALRKFQGYMSRIFTSKQRDYRIMAIGILVSREIDTTVAKNGKRGLTLGEIYAFLSWMQADDYGFSVREGVRQVLELLRDNPAVWGSLVVKHLQPNEVIYAPPEQEEDTRPFWMPEPGAHEREREASVTVPF